MMVSLSRKSNKKYGEEWSKYRLILTFRGEALAHLKEMGYTSVLHSEVLPNSKLMYLRFLKDGERGAENAIHLSGKDSCVTATFLFSSKTEYEVIKGAWLKTYDLKRKDGFYCIDRIEPKRKSRWD